MTEDASRPTTAPETGAAQATRRTGSVLEGIGYAALVLVLGTPLNMFVFGAFSRDQYGMLVPLLFLGVGQLVYVLPLALVFRVRRRTGTLKGLAIAAGTVFLINSLCTFAMYSY